MNKKKECFSIRKQNIQPTDRAFKKNHRRLLTTNIRLLAPILFCFVVYNGFSQPGAPPNILFILVDDLGCDDMGFSGSTYYETPHIDSLANRSTVFTRAYSASSVCSPSRASILTGTWPTVHGITDYFYAASGEAWNKMNRHTRLLPPAFPGFLKPEFTTLAQALQAGGYRTLMAGKWHLGREADSAGPLQRGFEMNLGGTDAGGPYTGGYFSPFNNPKLVDRPEERGMSYAMKLATEVNRFIETNQHTPFFAYLSFYEVHAPIQCTQPRWAKYRTKAEQQGIKDKGFDSSTYFPLRKYQDNPIYAGLVEQMDEAVGAVLQKLKSLGLDKNTIIIFTGDNGGVNAGDDYSTAPLHYRGGKGMQWEGGTRVPLLVSVPWLKQIPYSNVPVYGIDFFPTLLQLAGQHPRINQKLNGKDISSLLTGGKIKSRPLFWHYPHYSNQGSEPASYVLNGDWKLIYYYEDQRTTLYHLAEDPFEKNDLAAQHPRRTQELRRLLFNWLQTTAASKPVPNSSYSSQAFAQWQQQIQSTVLPRLEAHRKAILNPDWQPNDNWWKSKLVIQDN